MSNWTPPNHVAAGDDIDYVTTNWLIDQVTAGIIPVDAINLPQPIHPSKTTLILLEAEGQANVDFPNTMKVFLSQDGVLYNEVAAVAWLFTDILEPKTLLVPIPKNWYAIFIAPYGFIKSALLF